jgi:hypothetical protein
MGGMAGFGGGRSTILSALMWVTFIITALNWAILIIFYWVSQASEGTPISWYASPYWWFHLTATGIFAAATIDSVQAVSFIFKPSVAATVTMAIATIVDIVGGYFMIIDYWGQCIFASSGLDSVQKIGCNNERLYVWVVAIGAVVAIITAFFGFVFALWDSAVRLVRSRQFGMASSGFQALGERGQRIVGGILGGAGGGTESTLQEPLGPTEGESMSEALYHATGTPKGVYGKIRNQAYPTYASVPRYQHMGPSMRRQQVIPRSPQ